MFADGQGQRLGFARSRPRSPDALAAARWVRRWPQSRPRYWRRFGHAGRQPAANGLLCPG